MKNILLFLFVLTISTNAICQDTLINMDGSLTIVPLNNHPKNPYLEKIQKLQFVDLKNQLITIDSNFNKPLIINTWATSCHPCVAEIPLFNKIYEAYKDSNIAFYALTFTEDLDRTVEFLQTHTYVFKHITASREYVIDQKLALGLPTTLFFDRNGELKYGIVGGSEDPEKQEKTHQEFLLGIYKIMND